MLATDKGKSGWEWQTTIFKHQGFPVEYIWMIQIIRSNSSKKVESPVSFFFGGEGDTWKPSRRYIYVQDYTREIHDM